MAEADDLLPNAGWRDIIGAVLPATQLARSEETTYKTRQVTDGHNL